MDVSLYRHLLQYAELLLMQEHPCGSWVRADNETFAFFCKRSASKPKKQTSSSPKPQKQEISKPPVVQKLAFSKEDTPVVHTKTNPDEWKDLVQEVAPSLATKKPPSSQKDLVQEKLLCAELLLFLPDSLKAKETLLLTDLLRGLSLSGVRAAAFTSAECAHIPEKICARILYSLGPLEPNTQQKLKKNCSIPLVCLPALAAWLTDPNVKKEAWQRLIQTQ